MPQFLALVCPVCAAPLTSNATRCAYCGAVVVVAVGTARIDPTQINRAVVDEQIDAFRAALRNRPTDEQAAQANYGLGVAYFNLGLLDDAVDALVKAARLTPENPHIQAQLAEVYTEQAERGDQTAIGKARDRIDRALRVDPANAPAKLVLAELNLRAGQWQRAAAIWRDVAADDPDAVRRPVADFLRANIRTTLRAPLFWSHPERANRRDQVWQQKMRWLIGGAAATLLLFVVGFLLPRVASGEAENVQWAFYIAALAAAGGAFLLGRREIEVARERVRATDMTVGEREFLSGESGDGRQLAEIAVAVADELQRQEDAFALRRQQEAEARAARESAKRAGWNGGRARRSGEAAPQGCGCVSVLLLFAVGSALVAAAMALA